MVDYIILGRKIELDTSKAYKDFYWQDGQPQLVGLNLEGMLEVVQSGEVPVDDLKEYMKSLRRWETDAPRKRALREMRREGAIVATADALFEHDGGEKIIDDLENAGVFAAYFLREVYGER